MIRNVFRPTSSCSRLAACLNLGHQRVGKSTTALRTLVTQKSDKDEVPVKASVDKDVFGTVSSDLIQQHEQFRHDDDGDDHDGEAEFRAKISDTMRPKPGDYLADIEYYLAKGDLKSALSIVDVEMKKEAVKPKEKHFRVLITACGTVGYAVKAFDLYNEYKSRHFKHNYGIYSDLFNACANCPFPEFGLLKANILRKELMEKQIPLPQVVYHNMIKAFARCGDLQSALAIADEMKENKIIFDDTTYLHLLYACTDDKQAGFRHALIIWRRMMNDKHMKPSLKLYHSLLKVTHDCGIGDETFTYDVLLECMSIREARIHREKLMSGKVSDSEEHDQHNGAGSSNQLSSTGLELVKDQDKTAYTSLVETAPTLPNLLHRKPNLDHVISVGSLKKPMDRLALLGGCKGFLDTMVGHGVQPDIKVFTYLMEINGSSGEVEENLLAKMEELKVAPDTIFLNMLLKNRAYRKDYTKGRETLDLFYRHNVEPDLVTYGCLAMCCVLKNDAVKLIKDMEANNYVVNMEIMGTLITNGCHRMSPMMVLTLLKMLDRREMYPVPKRLLSELEKFHSKFRKHILSVERGQKQVHVPKIVKHEIENNFKWWKMFCDFYHDWLKRNPVEASVHPWRQFLTEKDVKNIKSRSD